MLRISLSAVAIFLGTLAAFSQSLPDSSAYRNRKLKVEEVNFVSSYYGQDGNNSAVTGGIGTEKLTDFATTIDVKLSRYDHRQRKHTLTGEVGIDVYTSASSDKIDPYSHKALAKELTIKFSVEETYIKANPVLLEVLIHNVISNAIRHATQGGSVIIESTPSCLMVSNSGEPFKHPEKIFQRFHRESRTTMGSGLGLSIVKKICEVAGYKMAYDFNSSMHHFKIVFRESLTS